jgi:type IV pilus assembly protein PilA
MGTRRSRQQGYTLIELMAVVAIMGILATLAIYGVRKYVLSAKTAEPIEMINAIRAAQESYKDETFRYLNVSAMTSYYPFAAKTDLGNKKMNWAGGNSTERASWAQLGVNASNVVQFGYACTAGQGAGIPSFGTLGVAQSLGYPTTATDWYVVRAAGDRDENLVYATFVGSSFTDQIYGENDTE